MKLDDLEPGMELSGTVLNVVDFGAFVDIGLPDSGLIHISRLADRFVRDPHQIVSVGDILTVWVVEVDRQRRRVSLTAIKPGTETPHPPRPQKTKDKERTGQRKPRGEGRPKGRRADGRRPGRGQHKSRQGGYQSPKPKSAPPPPITDAMKEGKEPMRSFSDLLQFYDKKDDEDKNDKKDDKKDDQRS
jgi:uncharacterized protein